MAFDFLKDLFKGNVDTNKEIPQKPILNQAKIAFTKSFLDYVNSLVDIYKDAFSSDFSLGKCEM